MVGHTDAIRDMLVTEDNQLITAASDKLINIFDLNDGSLLDTLSGHAGGMLRVALIAGGNELLSYSNDGLLKLWNLTDRSLIADLAPQIRTSPIFQLDATHKVVLGINYETKPQLWHLDSPQEGLVLEGHSQGVSKLKLSGDGKVVVTAAGADELFIWDAASAEVMH